MTLRTKKREEENNGENKQNKYFIHGCW